MMKRVVRFKLAPFLLLLVAFMGAGCSRNNYKEKAADFQKGVSEGSVAISAYYNDLNPREVDLYLHRRLLDPTLSVATTDEQGKSTPLGKPPFDPKAIQARIALLRTLAAYGQNLSDLAGSDAPGKFRTNMAALQASFLTLETSFNALGNAGAPGPEDPPQDTKASQYVAPLSKIAGVIGAWFIERKRQGKLTGFITEAAPEVRKIMNFLAEDLDTFAKPLIESGANVTFRRWMLFYNEQIDIDRDKKRAEENEKRVKEGKPPLPPLPVLTMAQRKEMLDAIKRAKQEYEISKNIQPSSVVRSMSAAHEALVKYAETGDKVSSLKALQNALTLLQDDVETLIAAVNEIRRLRRGEGGSA